MRALWPVSARCSGDRVAKALIIPKRFTILLFLIGLSAALIAADYLIEMVVMLMGSATGEVGALTAEVSLGMIIVGAIIALVVAKSGRAISAILLGFVAGSILKFLLLAGAM